MRTKRRRRGRPVRAFRPPLSGALPFLLRIIRPKCSPLLNPGRVSYWLLVATLKARGKGCVCFHAKAKPPLCAEFLSSAAADKLSLSAILVYCSGLVIACSISSDRCNQSRENATEKQEGGAAVRPTAVERRRRVCSFHRVSMKRASGRRGRKGRRERRKNQIFPLGSFDNGARKHPLNPIA